MIVAATLYAIVGAAVFGWLLSGHLSARNSIDRVPMHIFVLMPILWGPVLLGVILLLAVAVLGLVWTQRGGW